MDNRQTLLVLLSVLLCSSQGLTESTTEATLVQRSSGTSTEVIPKSTPQENVSTLLEMMNILNRRLTKTVIRHEEMNTRIMTRLDEMNSETVKRLEEINSTMMTRLDEMNKESLRKSEEIDNKIKSLDISITNSSEINQNKYLTLSQDIKKLSTKLEAHLQEFSSYRKEKQFVQFTDEPRTWQGAYDDCRERNMSLASIESEEENNKLASLILEQDGGTHFWLSGTDLGHTGRYVWKSTGPDVTYNQWAQTEPTHYVYRDGEQAHCMYVWSGSMLWADYKCSERFPYICQHWV